MAARRRFSVAFKRQVVEEVLAGAATMAQVCRRYELCPTVIGSWKQQYAQGRLAEAEGAGQDQGLCPARSVRLGGPSRVCARGA